MRRCVLLAAALACASSGHWPPRPAKIPPTAKELEIYDMTVHGDLEPDRTDFAEALSARHFRVTQESRHGHWDVYLTREGDDLVATLRSDGFFVDEAVGKDVVDLAHTLAVSQRVNEFIKNSGLPVQRNIPGR